MMAMSLAPTGGGLSSVIVVNDHGFVTGGQAKVAIDSALQLRSLGLDVCFVAGVGPLDQRLVDAGVECHSLGDHDILSDPNRVRAASRGIWNPAAARLLAKCIADRDPKTTVIHVHGWAKALSPSIGPVITRSKAAHIYTLHEYFLACPNGGFYDYRSGEICRRRPLGIDCLTTRCDARADHHKMWRIARQAVLWTAGGMPSGLRELIYLAPEQVDILRPYVPADARWHYLPNPAGPQPDQRVRAEENETFLFVGRLSPEKGAVVAAKAAALAKVPIAFCGDGDERGAVLQANPDAQMLGWLSQDQLSEWISRARCVVFPSLWYETYGLVVSDALRAGLPVLVSQTCVASSLVENGISGDLLPPGDVEAWADALCRLQSDDVVKAYSTAAFRAGQHFAGHDELTSRLLEIYKSIISRRHSEARSHRELVSC